MTQWLSFSLKYAYLQPFLEQNSQKTSVKTENERGGGARKNSAQDREYQRARAQTLLSRDQRFLTRMRGIPGESTPFSELCV